jgi:hypothetical protein
MRITKTEIKQMIEEEALSYLREEDDENESGLIDINAGPEEVLNKVPELLKNPKFGEIVRAGLTDAAGPDDEKIEIRSGTRTARDLHPTQSQIGAGQSLNDQASDNDFGGGDPTNLDRAIKGGKLASQGGEFPILVYKNWVLDGHHRWSQFVTTNPGATVDVVEVVAPGIKDEKGALALLHFMNFALFGKSPTKDFKGANIYTLDGGAIKDQALIQMKQTERGKNVPEKLFKAGLIETPTPEAAANHFAKNLANLNGPGKYPRLMMPQPGDSGSKDGYATTPDAAAAGEINYQNPVASDLQESKCGSNKVNITIGRLKEIIKEELVARKQR